MNATISKTKVTVKWTNLNFPNITGINIYEIEKGKELDLVNFLNSSTNNFKYVLEDYKHVPFQIIKCQRNFRKVGHGS